jgi:hypothetical protein
MIENPGLTPMQRSMPQPADDRQASMSALADKLYREHHELDRLCWDMYKQINADDRAAAISSFEQFAAMMEPHFQDEDDRLFLFIVEHNPRLATFARDMAIEHDKMRQIGAEMNLALREPFGEHTLFLCERLLRVLRGHAQKEELLLFQHTDDPAH